MSITGYLRGLLHAARSKREQKELLAAGSPGEISRPDWARSLSDPTGFYRECFRYFHCDLPPELRAHREYFATGGRGFGEAAFHVMWFLLFREFQPRTFLEIGIFRGQTISLVALLQRMKGSTGETAGISPFLAAGDSVSKYPDSINYLDDTLANFAHFALPMPELLTAFSTDEKAREFIAARSWDCIYIDGNHDYDVAKADWEACSAAVRDGGLVVLDDSSLSTRFEPPAFATKGHPGPSRVADELDRSRFAEILQVGHNRDFQKIAAR